MHIVVSGAGIAGPALAHGLVAAGHRVTVVEAAAAPRPGGQAVDVRGPALEVAERMGIGVAVRRARTDMRGMSIVAPDGRELMSTTSTTLTGGPVGGPDVEILRDDLAAMLLAAVPGAEYRFGDRIAALTEHDDGVEVDAGERADRARGRRRRRGRAALGRPDPRRLPGRAAAAPGQPPRRLHDAQRLRARPLAGVLPVPRRHGRALHRPREHRGAGQPGLGGPGPDLRPPRPRRAAPAAHRRLRRPGLVGAAHARGAGRRRGLLPRADVAGRAAVLARRTRRPPRRRRLVHHADLRSGHVAGDDRGPPARPRARPARGGARAARRSTAAFARWEAGLRPVVLDDQRLAIENAERTAAMAESLDAEGAEQAVGGGDEQWYATSAATQLVLP